MDFRFANTGEAEALTNLFNRAFKVEQFFIDGDRVKLTDVVERMVKGRFLVLEEGRSITACVYLEQREAGRAYLGLLAVEPARQSRGFGSALMQEAEKLLEAAGSEYVDIQVVNLRTELPSFYSVRGYVETGTAPFPENEPVKKKCHFIAMTKEL